MKARKLSTSCTRERFAERALRHEALCKFERNTIPAGRAEEQKIIIEECLDTEIFIPEYSADIVAFHSEKLGLAARRGASRPRRAGR